MAEYAFVTRWRFDAPIEQVWDAIRVYRAWPRWWPAIARTRQVKAGDAQGLGEVVEFVFRTRLGYRLGFEMTTTAIEPPRLLAGTAAGELAGTGRWELSEDGGGTRVVYYWNVETTRWWMRVLAPIARPAFSWNHDQVMKSGETGLARLLAARRVSPA